MIGAASPSRSLYKRGALVYDRVNAIASLGTSRIDRRNVIDALDLPPEASVLDLGCGTGDLALHAQTLLGPQANVIGVDPCDDMLARARARGVAQTANGHFESIPLPSGSVDAVVSAYAIRYANDLRRATDEMYRVLKPGGRLVLLEFTRPRTVLTRTLLATWILGCARPLCVLTTRSMRSAELLEHLWCAIETMWPQKAMTDALAAAGFDAPHCDTRLDMFATFTARRAT